MRSLVRRYLSSLSASHHHHSHCDRPLTTFIASSQSFFCKKVDKKSSNTILLPLSCHSNKSSGRSTVFSNQQSRAMSALSMSNISTIVTPAQTARLTGRMRKISKAMARILRHEASKLGLPITCDGWVPIKDLLKHLPPGTTVTDIKHVTAHNNKKRYQIDGDRIRACQGHTDPCISKEKLEESWKELDTNRFPILYHGTKSEFIPSIHEKGLLPGKRTHVHMAESPNSVVDTRSNVDIFLKIDARRAKEAGCKILQSQNGMFLAEHVPPEFILFDESIKLEDPSVIPHAMMATGAGMLSTAVQVQN